MKKNLKTSPSVVSYLIICVLLVTLGSCGGGYSATATYGGGGGGTTTSTLTSNTTAIASVRTSYGGTCSELSRNISSCQAARTALGLTGNWLLFSCNVTLGLATSTFAPTTSFASAVYVSITSSGYPDYTSNYFKTTGSYSFTANGNTIYGTFASMYNAYSTTYPDPNYINSNPILMYVPLSPTASTSVATSPKMGGGTVGIALNGVAVYNSVAGQQDSIFAEDGSFDQCQAHPEVSGQYHYHSEPYAISFESSNLIGVMRDGYFIYGRYEYGSTTPISTSNVNSLAYIYGGTLGVDPVTGQGPSIAFHYHAIAQVGCLHQNSTGTSYSDNGNVTCSSGMATTGTSVTSYFLTGKGNGGVFMSVPTSTVNGATMI